MKPDETELFAKLQACLKDIKNWMSIIVLLSHSDKTEVIIFGLRHLRNEFDNFMLASSTTMRNFQVILNQDMSFKQDINQVCKTAFFHLHNITKMTLSQGDAEKVIHAFVTSRLNYCNTLLAGCPNN